METWSWKDIPNGSVVRYRNKDYWVSDGLDDRIVTNSEGTWRFIKDLEWKTVEIYNLVETLEIIKVRIK